MKPGLSIWRALTALLLATGLTCFGTACGTTIAVAYLDRDYYWNDHNQGPVFVYDGLWRGEYVFYRGRWYLHGYGTPYYDPWGWYW